MWIRVSYWRNPEKIQPFLLKGGQCFISGELTQREYERDGHTKTSLELNANVIDLVGSKREGGQQPAQQRPAQSQPDKPRDNFDDVPFDDDIPF